MITTSDAIALARHYAEAHDVNVREVFGYSRTPRVVAARDRVYAGLRVMGGSYPAIGRLLGRDHSTVMHGVRKVLVSPERHGPRSDDSEARASQTASE